MHRSLPVVLIRRICIRFWIFNSFCDLRTCQCRNVNKKTAFHSISNLLKCLLETDRRESKLRRIYSEVAHFSYIFSFKLFKCCTICAFFLLQALRLSECSSHYYWPSPCSQRPISWCQAVEYKRNLRYMRIDERVSLYVRSPLTWHPTTT